MKTAIDTIREAIGDARQLIQQARGVARNGETILQAEAKLDAALAALKSLEGQGWVSVKERLPETGLTVLVWSPTCLMHSMRYYPTSAYPWRDNDPKDEGSFSTIPDVAYWQPLPAPPTTQDPT